ncbi:hypothetical protein E4U42_002442 [Claviceps africana]|uniref:Cell wall galactomannoprotein n=1 Tax=Claviceps africana TaxID=83212 RepID=A0A8K0NM93_9HYPO|nr:hypothetical protein E4U42_002442 [Claviceps africana]
MKFASPLLVLTAVSGAYSLVVPRDGKDTIEVLNRVQAAIDGLDDAVQDWTTDPTKTLEASNKLIGRLDNGTASVKAGPSMNLFDAVILLEPMATLKMHAQTLVDDMCAKKQKIESQGLCDAVRSQIDEIDTSSKSLVDATISKIPDYVQAIAKFAAQPIMDSIDMAKQAFSEKNCVHHS